MRGLEPNTSYVLQRAVDTNLDGICTRTSWLTLRMGGGRRINPVADDSRALNIGANILAKLGDKDSAIDYMRRSVAMDPEDPLLLYNAACTFAMLGEPEEALSTLERSVEKGYADKQWIERDNDLDPIRATARFKAIEQAM